MGSIAGYKTTIKKSGTATAFTGEAMTGTGAGPYQLNTAAKRVLDRDTVPTFYDDGAEIAAGDIASIDYMFGKVTFTEAKTGTITASGKYMPMTAIAQARSYALSRGRDLLDDTAYGGDGYRTHSGGLRDVSVTISRHALADDAGDTWKEFMTLLAAGTPIVIEIQPGGTGSFHRGWFRVESTNQSGDVAALEAEELSFRLDGDTNASYSTGT